jgi:NADP-dependent 3-hydroxy acid dehydrogenase YdfG
VLQMDVTVRADVEKLVQLAVSQYGRIDVMINNAGIMPLSNMANLKVEEWERTIDVNVKGVLYGIGASLPFFQKQKSGHIINISSAGGRRVYPGCAVYCGTKFAVRAISEGLRQDINPADHIKVTVIEPGAVRTELPNSISDPEQAERLKSWGSKISFLEADDVAEAISYALAQADRVNVDEILMMPREQGH